MNELRIIIESCKRVMKEGKRAALATVVRVKGSAYRRPGARMLVTRDGHLTGTLSGGCLEADVAERAQQVIASGASVVVRYDTTSADDMVWGLGLGCDGVIDVLIEPIEDNPPTSSYLHLLEAGLTNGERVAVATVIGAAEAAEVETGARLLLKERAECKSYLADHELERRVRDDAMLALGRGKSECKTYESPAPSSRGRVEVFIEIVEPPTPLIVFGAGHDAVPVVRLAQELGWHTTVVDTRARAASQKLFAAADRVILTRPEELRDRLKLDARTVAVMMTHNYPHDVEVLRLLLSSPARYVGCLGPRRRIERLLAELLADGFLPNDAYLSALHAPIGLDIGADMPEEIALSIIAEIRAVIAKRAGGKLREHAGAIHGEVLNSADAMSAGAKLLRAA